MAGRGWQAAPWLVVLLEIIACGLSGLPLINGTVRRNAPEWVIAAVCTFQSSPLHDPFTPVPLRGDEARAIIGV